MSRLAFVLYALSFALMTGGFLLVVRWLVNDFRIRCELLAEPAPVVVTYDDFCAESAEQEARYAELEHWLHNGGAS